MISLKILRRILIGCCLIIAVTANAETALGIPDEAAIANIMSRASVRNFTDTPVEKEVLDELVKAGMAAPTGGDRRPWEFVIVTDPDILMSLNGGRIRNLNTAQAAIVVCGDKAKSDYWVLDCSAASENILLAANAYGLGAVWCAVYPNNDRSAIVSEVLNLPENIIPLNIIAIGYPIEAPNPKDKFDSGKIHYQTW